MKKLITGILVLFSLVIVLPAYAGAGHDHEHGSHSHGPVSADKAQAKALKKVEFLASKGTVASSWTSAKFEKAEKKTFGKNIEWVVSFKNDKVKDKSKQTLYIFLSLDGRYIAANYTGK